ncbi:MAG: cytochrome c3 family protein [Gemmatimonadota bacterium]
MKKAHVRRFISLPAALVLFGSMLGSVCEDETVVEVERPFFEDPPALAAGFLGYDDQAAKLTVCGNCHVGQQAGWEETHHADAYATLENTGHAQDFCRVCHTVGPNGNATEGDVGWVATGDSRYHDVQCEACHGPGEAHVNNPDATQPLAQASVGVELDSGCGECHQGTHHGFVDEWAVSPHAMVVDFAAAREECAGCHRGQATIARFGENADYIEKFDSDPLPVVCVVCHDPHDATNEHQLRFPVNTTSIETHLCAQCHNRRTAPDPSSSHGLEPHSPESALLVGDAGWFPPNSQIDQGEIRGTHGSEANPELCATCHLAAFEVEDAATGDFVFNATGHLFRPIPCLDASGVPLPLGDELLEEVDPNGEDPGGAIDPNEPTFTIAEGALFNYHLATFGNSDFGTNTVVGSSVHNPFLVEALLIASIEVVEEEYGVMNSLGVADWDAELQAIKSKAGR